MRGFPSVQFGCLLSASALGLLITGAANAQQQTATTAEARGDSLQEIVVTATKRESTVETTPISITAITGQELQDRGITDIASVVQSVPGVSMRTSGPGQTELEMRGMTSSGGNSSTVGFYLDDTPLTSPSSAQNGKVVIDPNLYDLNRIEVLRGPQGTLYGSGSMGGTIKLVPNAPDPKAFDASGELILGHTQRRGYAESHRERDGQPAGGRYGGLANRRLGRELERLDQSHRDRQSGFSRARQWNDAWQCGRGAGRRD